MKMERSIRISKTLVLLLIAMTFSLANCKKSGSQRRGGINGGFCTSPGCFNNGGVHIPPNQPGIFGTPTGGASIAMAVGRNYSFSGTPRMELSLNMFTPAAPQGRIDPDYYSGPFEAAGFLTIFEPDPVCGLVPGEYQVQSLGPGQWFGGLMFGNLMLEGVSPNGHRLRFQLPNNQLQGVNPPMIDPYGDAFDHRIQLTMFFDIPCAAPNYELE